MTVIASIEPEFDRPEFERLVGRRVRSRTRCNLVVEVRVAGREWERALLVDLSSGGFGLTWSALPRDGDSLWLRISDHPPIAARVRWKRGDAAGCEFLDPLDNELEATLWQLVEAQQASLAVSAYIPAQRPAA